jgi:hypothetical protein
MTRRLGSLPASIILPLKFKTKAVRKAFQSFAVALNPVQWRARMLMMDGAVMFRFSIYIGS